MRVLTGLLLAGLIAAALGSAAALDVGGGAIQAGVDDTLACDDDGVSVVGWGLETDTGLVHTVRIGGINADDCKDPDPDQTELFVLVKDGSGTTIATGSHNIPDSASGADYEASITLSSAVSAAAIESLQVFIEAGE